MTTSANKPAARNRQRKAGPGSWPGPLLLVLLIGYPLACLIVQTVMPHLFDSRLSAALSLHPFAAVFRDKFNVLSVLNSLALGLAASVAATVLGTITAYAGWKAPVRTKRWIGVLVWLTFFSPSYLIAEGWSMLMQDGGILAQIFHLQAGWSTWFFGRFGLIAIMGLRYFPFVHLSMSQAFDRIGGELVQAGRMLGARQVRIFRRILFPLLTPAWLAGASIAFAEGFGDFGLAAAIAPQAHIPMITFQIYTALNQSPVDYPAAAALSLIVIVVTGGVLWAQFRWLNRRDYAVISANARPPAPALRIPGTAYAAMAIAGLAFALPIAATFSASLWRNWSNGPQTGNWTLDHYTAALQLGGGQLAAIARSMGYGLLTAAVATAFGLLLSYLIRFRPSAANRLLETLLMATIAVPGVVIAASFVFAWNAVWLIPIHLVLYGTPLCLGLAYLAISLPYAVRLHIGAIAQFSPNLVTAAQVEGARQWRILTRIVAPLLSATSSSCFYLTFAHTFFELPASSLLYPAGQPPLPVTIADAFTSFDWPDGAAMAVIGLLLVAAIYGLGQLSFGNWRKVARERRTDQGDPSRSLSAGTEGRLAPKATGGSAAHGPAGPGISAGMDAS